MFCFCGATFCIYNEDGVCVKRAITLGFDCVDVLAPGCQNYESRVYDEEEEEDDAN